MATVTHTGAASRDAAQALYERYYAGVYRYARSQLRSPQDAEDAAQNTFLRAYAALQRGVVPQNEAAWIFKIAHNVCLSSKLAWLRRRRVETPRDLDTLTTAPTAREARRDELVGLDDALAAMPPRLREAFLLREWQGLSYDEIAERLDTSRSAVETLIFRARRRLAEELESPLQRVRRALGLGPLLDALRGLLGGGSVAVKAAGAVAVLAGATVAAKPLYAPAPRHATHPAPAAAARRARPAAPTSAVPARHAARRPHGSRPVSAAAPQQPGGGSVPAQPQEAPASGSAPDAASATPFAFSTPAGAPPAAPPLPPAPAPPIPPSPALPPAAGPGLPSAPAPSPTLPAAPSPSLTTPAPALPPVQLSVPPVPTVTAPVQAPLP